MAADVAGTLPNYPASNGLSTGIVLIEESNNGSLDEKPLADGPATGRDGTSERDDGN